VLLAAHRARTIVKGSAASVELDDDKPTVVALREIAEQTISATDMRERLIHATQNQVEVDEPEVAAAPVVPAGLRPALGQDCRSTDTAIDIMTEEELLRALGNLTPEVPERQHDSTEGSGVRRQ
jgi:DNA-directed RNA polymerase subunit omega